MLGLLVIGVLRAFELAESRAVPRSGIGESRWFAFATRPDLQAALERWLGAVGDPDGAGPGEVELAGIIDLSRVEPGDRSWLLTMLRYACPGSAVELDDAALRLEPACRPDLPEFLVEGRKTAAWTWIFTMSAGLLLGLALTGRGDPRIEADPASPEESRAATARMEAQRSPTPWAERLAALTVAWLAGWAALALSAAIAWAVVPADWVPADWVPGLCGAGAVVGALTLWSRRRFGARGPGHRFEVPVRRTQWSTPEWVLVATGALLATVSVGKVLRTELWSWDYVAAWGFRARKIAMGSHEFLELPGFNGSNPDYPLGLAFSWLVGTGGGAPSGGDVRVATLLMLLAIGVLLFAMLGSLNPPQRVLVVGAMLGGPLIWDTEGLGLAELPLVLWLTATIAIWTPIGNSVRRAGGLSLVFLVMVAWTKQEGFVLAALLGVPGALWCLRRYGRRAGALWTFALVGSLAAVRILTAAQTEHGTSFLEGEAWSRFMERTREPLEVLLLLPEALFHPQWLPWCIALGALGAHLLEIRAPRLRPVIGPLVVAVSVAAATAYVMVYFATYLEPADHIATSWHRILGPLLWMFFLGLAMTAVEAEPSRERAP